MSKTRTPYWTLGAALLLLFSFSACGGSGDSLTDGNANPNAAPNGTITAPAPSVAINPGEAVSFAGSAADPNGDLITVLWDFGDGPFWEGW